MLWEGCKSLGSELCYLLRCGVGCYRVRVLPRVGKWWFWVVWRVFGLCRGVPYGRGDLFVGVFVCVLVAVYFRVVLYVCTPLLVGARTVRIRA